MRLRKKILYVILAALTTCTLASLIAWSAIQDLALLIVSASLAGVFFVYFFFLALYNMKTGWMDEKTPRRRVLSEEKLLLDAYPRKRGVAVDVYLASEAENTVAAIARVADHEGSDADMVALSAVYVGYTVLRTKDIPRITGKIFAIGGNAEIPALRACAKKNTFLYY